MFFVFQSNYPQSHDQKHALNAACKSDLIKWTVFCTVCHFTKVHILSYYLNNCTSVAWQDYANLKEVIHILDIDNLYCTENHEAILTDNEVFICVEIFLGG